MRILYHHRTRATDAQRVHILEIVRALRGLGHSAEIVSLVDTEAENHDATAEAGEAWWKRFALKLPFAYEAMQLGYNLVGIPMLVRRIRATHADFLYERYSLFNFSGVVAAWLCRIPIVLEVNSPFALEQAQLKEVRARRLALAVERAIVNHATRTVVVSGPLRRIMVESGCAESKLVLMPNGVNLDHLANRDGADALRERFRLRNKVVIGFVGWFRPWHGLEFLIDNFADAGLAESNAALLLIGDGPAMPALKQKVRDRGLGRAVVFAGAVAHEDLPPYLALVDIAAQPAANEYCCPMKIIEYMGTGKAIVAPRQVNIQELVTDGHDAALFTPGDGADLRKALIRLVSDTVERNRMGDAARESVLRRELLWEKNAAKIVALGTRTSTPAGRGGEQWAVER